MESEDQVTIDNVSSSMCNARHSQPGMSAELVLLVVRTRVHTFGSGPVRRVLGKSLALGAVRGSI